MQGKRGPKLPCAQWALSSVMQREENVVLLGFSSDGHFLRTYAVLFAVYLLSVAWTNASAAAAVNDPM